MGGSAIVEDQAVFQVAPRRVQPKKLTKSEVLHKVQIATKRAAIIAVDKGLRQELKYVAKKSGKMRAVISSDLRRQAANSKGTKIRIVLSRDRISTRV